MKVSFNFDTGTRRIRLRAEDPLEEVVLKEMAELCGKGVNMKITNLFDNPRAEVRPNLSEFEIEMRINGFEKEKKSE